MNLRQQFEDILKPDQIIDDERLEAYDLDRTKMTESKAHFVLLPKSVHDVSRILKHCHQNDIKVIPAGGRTGLSGAIISDGSEILISLEKMANIVEIDPIGATICVETGAILENVQVEVEKHELYFPLDFAAKGSCMIGGCLSTNAGGVKVIKYGMTRQFVLGLEVVLMDGRIIDMNKALIKDNSGYDLKQLFIGAEGTLGIITKATFQCESIPKHKNVVMLSVDSFANIPLIFKDVMKSGIDLLAFEFITDIGMMSVIKAMPQIKNPFDEDSEYYVLVEFDEQNQDNIMTILEKLADGELILDAVFADNSEMFRDFWTIREAVSDSLYLLGPVHANDVSVPIKDLHHFVIALDQLMKERYDMFTLGLFGHIGDGNFHIYIIDEKGMETEEFHGMINNLDEEMFTLVSKFNGSVSAEHGIGIHKKSALSYQKSELEIKYASELKKVFDPKNLMNPGKLY